jgi:hypothetical protein
MYFYYEPSEPAHSAYLDTARHHSLYKCECLGTCLKVGCDQFIKVSQGIGGGVAQPV